MHSLKTKMNTVDKCTINACRTYMWKEKYLIDLIIILPQYFFATTLHSTTCIQLLFILMYTCTCNRLPRCSWIIHIYALYTCNLSLLLHKVTIKDSLIEF